MPSKFARLLFPIALLATVPGSASAHSLDGLASALQEKEAYFEPVARPAPAFDLQDAAGHPVSLADLRGKVVVLHFVYASCPDVCPLHAEKLAEVQRMVNQTPMRDQVRFVTVTTDPEHDTPEVMRGYGDVHGLDPVNWTFLTSGADAPEATRALAEAFGHTFALGDGGYQTHGVVTHVIDREGALRANFHGLAFDPTNLVVYVNALVNDVHGPEHDREAGLWDRLRALF